MKSGIKEQKGVTILALMITVIVLIIIASVGLSASLDKDGNIEKSQDAIAKAELSKIQQAVLENYVKYTQTKDVHYLRGDEVSYSDAQNYITELNNLKDDDETIELKQPQYDSNNTELEQHYYKLNKTNLAEMGLKKITNNDEYIVNYSSGEVFNITQKKTVNGDVLYVFAKNNNYVKDGLMLHLDGINNTGNGHSATATTWKDLSGNGNDGTLHGATWSGGNLLQFDGTDDWVGIKQMDYDNVTLEVVMEYLSIGTGEREIIANFQGGGYGILNSSSSGPPTLTVFAVYIEGKGYRYAKALNNYQVNKKYSLSGSYDGNIIRFRENSQKYTNIILGQIEKPNNSTIMVLGADPSGNQSEYGFIPMKLYSVRIYNRALTDEELEHNYNVDKTRFGITD